MIEHFYNESHDPTHPDINAKIFDFCDTNDQQKRKDFWMNILRTLYAEGLSYR